MEQTVCSESLAFKLQTLVNNLEESIWHTQQGKSLNSLLMFTGAHYFSMFWTTLINELHTLYCYLFHIPYICPCLKIGLYSDLLTRTLHDFSSVRFTFPARIIFNLNTLIFGVELLSRNFTKLFITQCFSASRYFLPCRFRYYIQHHVLENDSSMSYPKCDRPNCTPT
jgi:hypothetical protein